MKNILLALVLVAVMVSPLFAATQGERCMSSGAITAVTGSAAVYAKPAILCGIRGFTDGTNNVVCTAYDNATAASGTIVGKWSTVGSNVSGGDNAPLSGVTAGYGIYVSVSGTGGSCIFYYRPGP